MRSLRRLIGTLVCLALLLSFVPAAAYAFLPPPPAGGVQLNAVQFIGDRGWAVGGFRHSDGNDYAVVKRSLDGGLSWNTATIAQAPYLTSVSMVSTSTGWAVGTRLDKVYKTTDGGVTWNLLNLTSDLLLSNNMPSVAHFRDIDDGWVAGGSLTAGGTIWKTGNGGTSWARTFHGPMYEDPLLGQVGSDTSFTGADSYDALNGFVVGTEVSPVAAALIFRTADGGSTWITESVPGGPTGLDAVATVDSTHAWAVGAAGTAGRIVSWDGSTWSLATIPGVGPLSSVASVDTTHVWAVGENGAILAFDGSTWTAQTSGTSEGLRGVSFTDAAHGWAVGTNETVLITSDGGLHWAPPGSKVFDYVPVQGAGRYATAVEAAKLAYASAGTVIVCWGGNFPDALGGAALAGAYDAPLLLTEKTTIPTVVRDEITSLGATHAVVIGSSSVVATAVLNDLATLVGGADRVERVAGADRYDTAAQVASATVAVIEAKGGTYDGKAFLATGESFPDALAASPVAFARKWPILLTRKSGLPDVTSAKLASIGANTVHVLGSANAVPDAVVSQLAGGITHDRWEGPTRYATAVDIATKSGLSWSDPAIATGEAFPDALAGGVMQGKLGSFVLLTRRDTLPPETAAALTANKGTIMTVRFLGSTSAVSAAVRTAVDTALH